MIQGLLVTANIALVAVTVLYVTIVNKQLKKSEDHFKENQIDFELAVQEQKRNQAESDVTQLRMKKAEFKANKRFEGDVKKIICDRLKQYEKSRTPQIENRIKELREQKKKLGGSTLN
ncbi:hypothetical protein ES703_59397 [subsurface metagenome]